MQKLLRQMKTVHVALFLALIYGALGLLVLDDYGISYDEETQRFDNGIVNYQYIFGEDKDKLLNGNEKYHGPAFEVVLVVAEKISGFEDSRPRYLLRHLINFLVFYLSAIVMFFLGRNCFKSDHWGLFAACMYVLSPRFFAESFYNSKDIVFLAFFTFSIYTLYRFSKDVSVRWAILHALITGFMIDVRVIGIFVPLATIAFIIYQWFLSDEGRSFRHLLTVLITYALAQAIVVVAFWPILWEGPWHHFTLAFSEMSKYHWTGEMRFMGELIDQDSIPWHYLPLWMVLTIPDLFLVLAVLGGSVIAFKLIPFNRKNLFESRYDHLFLGFFLLPLMLIILKKPVVYDGWRHVYFLYAPFVLLATRGSRAIIDKVKDLVQPTYFRPALIGFFVVVFAFPVLAIFNYHPFEYVYFNGVAKACFSPLEQKFEMDYWGLSNRQGLEYILKNDTSPNINLHPQSPPGIDNRLILSECERKRLDYRGELYGVGTYILNTDRGSKKMDLRVDSELIHRLNTPSGPVLSIYKTMDSLHVSSIIRNEFWDFESEEDAGIATVENLLSGSRVNKLGKDMEYGKTLRLTLDTNYQGSAVAVNVNAEMMSEEQLPRLLFVVSVDRNGENVYWNSQWLGFVIQRAFQWERWNLSFDLGEEQLQVGDQLTMFFWSPDKQSVYLDNVGISVLTYESPALTSVKP